MKRKFLFLVTMLTMAWAGMMTANATTKNFIVNGQDVTVKDGEIQIGDITVTQEDRVLTIVFNEIEGQTLNVASGDYLIRYEGDDFDYVVVAFSENLEINHNLDGNTPLFQFWGSGSDPLEVYFANNLKTEDVTLTINTTSEQDIFYPVFFINSTRLHLNPEDLNDKTKLNLDVNSFWNVFFCNTTVSYVNLGYGDYHFSCNNMYGETDVFSGRLVVNGLGRFDSYDAHNYISIPHGIYCYTEDLETNPSVALYNCQDAMDFNNRYRGELTLRYAPSDWAYFDDEEYSDWKLTHTCDGAILYITSAGDLSSLDPDDLPWKQYADAITEVYVSSNVMIPLTKLPKAAFKGLTALKKASLYGAYELEEIPEECFAGCNNLEEITFNDYGMGILKTIGEKAFYECSKLGTVILPEGVEEIGNEAFRYCSVSDITLPATLKTIGNNYTFDGCHTLRIPKGIGEVKPSDATKQFGGEDCSLYYEGTLEEWLTGDFGWVMRGIKAHMFIDGKELIDLVIPEGITEVKKYAFSGYTGLKSVTFPTTLTRIGQSAFSDCTGLTAINLPDNITVSEPYCFANCENVTMLKLSKGLTSILLEAFRGLSITELTIPDGVTMIAISAFYNCTKLTEVTLPESLTNIYTGAFSVSSDKTSSLTKIILPAGIGEVTLQGSKDFAQVTDIRFGGDLNTWLGKSRSWLMNCLTQSADLYLAGSDEPLKDVVIPEGITGIPAQAFRKTSVSSLTLPAEVTSIEAEAFAGCSALASAETKAKTPAALGENAFKDIDENAVLKVYASAVTAYEASDWAKYFKIESAFAEYNVTAASSNEALGEVTLTFDDKDMISKGEEKNSFVVGNNAKGHLVATPKDKYTDFVRWNDDAEGFYQAERDITVTGDFDYIATFQKDSFNVAVEVKGIDPSLVKISGAGKYGRGDNVTLTFTMNDEHYTFEEWHFDKNHFKLDETLVFDEIDANHDVQIVFKAKYYTVSATVTPAEAGVVKGQGDYEYGTNYTLTLEPAEGYELKEWRDGGALDEKSNILTGYVYGEIHIECVLQLKHYTVNTAVNDEKMGSVSGAGSYEHGSTVTLTATANTGYNFKQWSDGNTDNPRTITVTEDKTYTAEFELGIVYHTVTFLDWNGDELLKEQVEDGKDAKGPATNPTRDGYEFTGWSKPITNITANLTVIAQYKEIETPDYKPQNLKAEVVTLEDKDQRITLSWDAVEGAPTYELQLFYNALSLYQSNTLGKHEVSILLSELQNEVPELAPGTYQIDWQVRSTDVLTQPMSEWVAGKQFEVIVPMPTGLDGIQNSEFRIQKILRNGRICIITPDGREYDTTGAKTR